MILAGTFKDAVMNFLTNEGWNIVLVLSVLIIAFVGIKLVASIITKILFKSKVDGSAIAFYIAILKVALWIVAIFAVASILSISTSSLVVGLSSVALAISLALKDSLSNLANGILIIYNKPFRRGDTIEIDDVCGVIKNIKLFTTELITADNRRITLPNSKVINSTIINNTSLPTRRLSFNFQVSYDCDVNLVEKTLIKCFKENPKVNVRPAPTVFMSEHGDSALVFSVKCWVDTENYWDVFNAMPGKVFEAFKGCGIEIPYNKLDVNIIADGSEKSAYKSVIDTEGGNSNE